LQVGTTHYLGDTFSNVYDIKFQSNENKLLCPFSMSAGISTRLIGAIVACHGDNKGIVLPFKISPIQINIISIRVDQNNERIFVIIKKLLSKYRINIDNTDNTFGYKINESEVKGIPINLIIGPEELKKNSVTLIRRDIGEKKTVSIDGIKNVIKTEIDEYNHNLYDTSKKKLEESIVKIENLNEFKKGIIGKKIILAP
jgi:prolyl-tRNA synthetase